MVGLTRDEREDLDEVAYALGVRVLVSESVSPRRLFDALYTATGRTRCPWTVLGRMREGHPLRERVRLQSDRIRR